MSYRPVSVEEKYGLAYYCVDNVLTDTQFKVDDFKASFHISDKNFKYVHDKLFLHYFFENVMSFLRENTPPGNYKPVLFLTDERLIQDDLKSEVVIKQIKLIKKLLPIPFVIPLSKSTLKSKKSGEWKELNEKILNFYLK